jgi:regulator of replication initiation timing
MDGDEIKVLIEELQRDVEAGQEGALRESLRRLLNLVERVVAENGRLRAENDLLRKQLKLPGPPAAAASSKSVTHDVSSEKERRQREQKPPQKPDRRTFADIPVHEERICLVDPSQLPPDAQFVGYDDVVVQELRIEPHNIRFRREIWFSATERRHIHASLPPGFVGEFGPELRTLLVSLKFVAGTSEPGARELLEGFGVRISPASVSNILLEAADLFHEEKRELFLAGLASTSYQHLDDTSATVNGQHWHTHNLGNEFYTAYFTTPRKDRLTVLDVLRDFAPRTYRWNDETWRLLRALGVAEKWLVQLHTRVSREPERDWSQAEMDRLLDEIWPAQVSTSVGDEFAEKSSSAVSAPSSPLRTHVLEATAIAAYHAQTAWPLPILVCDDAAQFKLLTWELALCWIHQGRHYKKLTPVAPPHQRLLDDFRRQFWDYYAELQAFRREPTVAAAERLSANFDRLFATRTGYDDLDDRIAKTREKKAELLTVLRHPEVPLHNNPAELGARVNARRRDVSLQTKNIRGTRALDTLTSIVQTAKKLGVRTCEYLRDRLTHRMALPSLATLIQSAAARTLSPLKG